MKYLKKRGLYGLAVSLLSYDGFPSCSHCSYRSGGAYEWLTFSVGGRDVTFSVMNRGVWVRVVEELEGRVVRKEVLRRMVF